MYLLDCFLQQDYAATVPARKYKSDSADAHTLAHTAVPTANTILSYTPTPHVQDHTHITHTHQQASSCCLPIV